MLKTSNNDAWRKAVETHAGSCGRCATAWGAAGRWPWPRYPKRLASNATLSDGRDSERHHCCGQLQGAKEGRSRAVNGTGA